MLATQLIIQVIAVYLAYLFGMFYQILSTFPIVWQGVHQDSIGIEGLNYLSLSRSRLFSRRTNSWSDSRSNLPALKASEQRHRPSRVQIPLTFVGSCLVPIGLFWYGWSVEANTHCIVPNIGITIFGAGAMICMQCMQT